MKSLLVIQLKPRCQENLFDDLLALEGVIEECVRADEIIDGNDIGQDEANLFVETNDPESLFGRFLSNPGFSLWANRIRAAYREDDSDSFRIFYPVGLQSFSVS
jgi:hypothetical protein